MQNTLFDFDLFFFDFDYDFEKEKFYCRFFFRNQQDVR